MISLSNYLVSEALEVKKNKGTRSNSERKEELISYLQGKNLSQYVDSLNDMLEDPKTKSLLVDGFGGELGDTKLVFNDGKVKVTALTPTQNEIDLSKSLNYGLINPKFVDYVFTERGLVVQYPLVTFKNEFVIDGHHRWSQVFAFNPKARMKTFNYNSSDINAQKMLKVTQGAIASVLAQRNKGEEIPSSKVEGMNIYDSKWDRKKIHEYIESVLTGKIPAIGDKYIEDGGKEFVETLGKYVKSVEDVYSACVYLTNNIMLMKQDNTPIANAPNRGDMPLTDKGGKNGDKSSSTPNSEGSALNKMKDGKFVSQAVD